jgi:Ni2+-binding GTPase involved in maturation of urease and hydrogenase
MKTVQLVFVGGFLGAGKTTLLWEAAKRLTGRGLRVGLITNDQAPDLVDTALLTGKGVGVREVAGSCFCCNFHGLTDAIQALITEAQADVILAEPVGSCTDLSATLMQPLKAEFAEGLVLAPLTVLVDPERISGILDDTTTLHPSAAYILRKQAEEADLLVLNKMDLLTPKAASDLADRMIKELGLSSVQFLSIIKDQGVDDWLSVILAHGPAGRRIADVDYDIYAEGEAVLGWLNASIRLQSTGPAVDWRAFCAALLANAQKSLLARQADVGHVKLFLAAGEGSLVGNLTTTAGRPTVRGEVPASATQAQLVFNARVAMSPQDLEQIVRRAIDETCGQTVRAEVVHLQSLQPGRPRPTHRYKEVVE